MTLTWTTRSASLAAAAAIAVFASGLVVGRCRAAAPVLPVFLCHDTGDGAPNPNVQGVTLADQFELAGELVTVGRSRLLCEPVEKTRLDKDGKTVIPEDELPRGAQVGDHLHCYRINRVLPGGNRAIADQFGRAPRVWIGDAPFLCDPADKGLAR